MRYFTRKLIAESESKERKTGFENDVVPGLGSKIPGMNRFYTIMTQDKGISKEEREEAKKLWRGFSEVQRSQILSFKKGDAIARYCAIFLC